MNKNKKIKNKIKIILTIFMLMLMVICDLAFANEEKLNKKTDIKQSENLQKEQDNLKENIKKYLFLNQFSGTEEAINPYPVGAVYITTDATDPNGFLEGSWARIEGYTLVGYNGSETEFNTLKKTGGEKNITLSSSYMPTHKHTFTPNTVYTEDFNAQHYHNMYYVASQDAPPQYDDGNGYNWIPDTDGTSSLYTSNSGKHKHGFFSWKGTIKNTGADTPVPIDIRAPYIVVYMWQRTA